MFISQYNSLFVSRNNIYHDMYYTSLVHMHVLYITMYMYGYVYNYMYIATYL